MGPWLVTKDEIANPDDLAVQCKVGGELIAEDSTRYYNYKVAEVVSFISQFHTLYPGDVISLGTAFKAGGTRKSIHQANFQTVAGPVEVDDRRPRHAGEPDRHRGEGARRVAAALSELERLTIRVALEDLNTAFCYHLDHDDVDCVARAVRRRRLLHARQPRVARQGRARASVPEPLRPRRQRTARHLYSGLKLDIESATRARGTSRLHDVRPVRRAAAVARDSRRSSPTSSTSTCAATTAGGASRSGTSTASSWRPTTPGRSVRSAET